LTVADVGLIGVGLVGGALAERLVNDGWRLIGYDRRPERMQVLTSLGGTAFESARAVAEVVPYVVLSLPDSDAVEVVVREIEPVLRGRWIVDTTTGDPERTSIVGRRLKAAGIDYVDATIAGSSREVREGKVIVMAGGEVSQVGICSRLFESFAAQWFHVGPWGSGARMKLAINLVLGLNRAVLAEGLSFARACGLDPQTVLAILQASAAYSRVMDTKGPKMITGDFSPEARLSQHYKDVRLILEAGRRADIELPLSEVHERLLASAEGQGAGDLDNSAIIRAFGREV
jgi:3-hydroxyisobutyrate dehydrogenase-like beta-hydroxyacid dehydrogenase